MNTFPKFSREGRCVCKACGKEVDLVVPIEVRLRIPGQHASGYSEAPAGGKRTPVAARHLNRIEGYTPRGAFPNGFCLGSLAEPEPTPPPTRHNHVTRDIKKPGKCPSCDEYHAQRARK